MIKFLTEFTNKYGVVYGWYIYADSWEEAQREVDKRGIGETVYGYIPE